MDWQTIFTAIIGAGTAIIGWFVNELKKDINTATSENASGLRALEQDLGAHKVEVARTHATKNDLTLIDQKLDRMNDKLDRLIERT